jgi:hypothetical protein
MSKDEHNLTGSWKGIFNYPRIFPPNQFDAELVEIDCVLAGETFEVGDESTKKGVSLHAMIEGRRSGTHVIFTKCYDDIDTLNWPIFYSGVLSQDGSEIQGMWDIPGNWSGSFLMVRAKPQIATIQREAAETVR